MFRCWYLTMTQYSIPLPVSLAAGLQSAFKSLTAASALFVQQLHYWTGKQLGEIVDGRRWIYNSYEKWRFQMPWLSDYGFRKVRQLLVDAGIILVEQLGLREQGRDRSCWYALNYEHELIKDDPWFSTSPSVDYQRIPNTTSDNSQYLTKTTTVKDPEVVVLAQMEEKEEPTARKSLSRKDMTKTSLEEIEAMHEDEYCATKTETQRKLLGIIRNLGIPLSKTLQRLVQRSSVETVESAIAAFKEQQEKGNVKVPTAFMIRAIQQGFQPGGEVKTQQELEEFNAWYKHNQSRILATYSHSDVTGLPEGQIGVMLRGSQHWVYWREVDADATGGGSGR